MTPQEMCVKLLENTKPLDDCLLWQGEVDDRGYAVARVDGRRVIVSRYIKLYEIERMAEQLNNLRQFRTRTCSRFTHCINPKHVVLSAAKGGQRYETLPDWRKVYGVPHGS